MDKQFDLFNRSRMASTRNIVTLLALCAVLAVAYSQVSQGGPHSAQGGPHQNQGRIRRQVAQENQEPANQAQGDNDSNEPGLFPVWTTCNFTETPRISCHDCNTRLICKPVGGLLKACWGPFRPYCNRGICSSTPSAECA